MVGFLSLLIPAVVILIAVAWGFALGVKRVQIRLICVGASFVIALIGAFIVKNIQYADLVGFMGSMEGDLAKEFLAFLNTNAPLQSVLTSAGGAVVAPIAFVAIFLLLAIASGIVCGIIFLITAILSPKPKQKAPVRIIVFSVVQMLLTIFVIMTPLTTYLDFAPDVVDAVVEMGVLTENSENAEDVSVEKVRTFVNDLNKAPLCGIHRVLGGKALSNSLSSFVVGEETTTLSAEVGPISRFAANIIKLTKNNIKNYGDAEAKALRNLSDCFEESKLLPTVADEIIYGATDAWLDVSGENKFLGVERPKFEDPTTAMFSDAFQHILEAFHSDSKNIPQLRRDFNTLANLVQIMAEDKVFEAMQEPSTNAIVVKLSSGTTVQRMIEELGKNSSFKILIGDITNIGMRAIGSSLKIPENAEEIYQQFTDDIAASMNALKAAGMTREEQKTELTKTIKDAFAESGNQLNLDDEVVGLYADTLLEDFDNYETITSNDVAEFFQVFTEVASSGTVPEQGASADTTQALSAIVINKKDREYKSPAYAGKTTEQLKNESAAGLLATVMQEIVVAVVTNPSIDEQTFANTVYDILVTSYENYAEATGKDASHAETFATVMITTSSVTNETITGTAAMQDADALAEVTIKITMEDLLSNPEDSANKLVTDADIQAEAAAIQSIFGSANQILDTLNNNQNNDAGESTGGMGNLGELAGSLGSALDGLSGTNTVGGETTNRLLTAVFQSETVRNSANMDLQTATDLANAATSSSPNGEKNSFADTMNSLSHGSVIADKLSKNEEILEEDVRSLLENMTPQTANMLKVYMDENRIRGFGVPEANVAISTELIQNLFTEMGDKEQYGDNYDAQTKGILKMFNLAMVAKDDNGATQIFNRSNVKGRLDATADEVVAAILESDMVCNALMKTLYDENEEIKNNPFGIKINENNADYIDCKNAVENYYKNHTDKSEELKLRLDTVAALFGVTGINYAD